CFALLDWSCDLLFSPTLPMGSEGLGFESRCVHFGHPSAGGCQSHKNSSLLLAIMATAQPLEATEEELDRTLFGTSAAAYYEQYIVVHSAEYITNSRNIRLYTQSWLPADRKPSALLFLCHGYANCCNWLMQLTAVRFASEGFAVFGIDFEGHGKSDGLRCSFRSAEHLVDDCCAFFASVKAKPDFAGLPSFVYGESLGGAIAVTVALRDPDSWTGLVMVSPMLRIKEELQPSWAALQVLRVLATIIPDSAFVPTKGDLIRLSCRDPAKLEVALKNPRRYSGNPRLGVAFELLRFADAVTASIPNLNLPFLIMHGGSDGVTDPDQSRNLHEKAPSKDKTLHIYPSAWHQLLQGEPEPEREEVWKDVLAWLKEKSQGL
ncbi:unnamed protein product, partial [Closterium sp. NIES-53]